MARLLLIQADFPHQVPNHFSVARLVAAAAVDTARVV
jgi:hypothetical protein